MKREGRQGEVGGFSGSLRYQFSWNSSGICKSFTRHPRSCVSLLPPPLRLCDRYTLLCVCFCARVRHRGGGGGVGLASSPVAVAGASRSSNR